MRINYNNRSTKLLLLSSLLFSAIIIIALNIFIILKIERHFYGKAETLAKEISLNIYQTNKKAAYMINNAFRIDNENKFYLQFVLDLLKFIQHYPATNINIYNNAQTKLISLKHEEIIIENKFDIYSLVSNFFIKKDISEIYYNNAIIRVTAPIKMDDQTYGNIEVYYDISKELEMSKLIVIIYFLLIITIHLLYYFLIFSNIKEAKNIITKQGEEIETLTKSIAAKDVDDKEKSSFITQVTHELRTPLNAIIGFASLIIQDNDNQDTRHKEYAEEISNSGTYLLNLINDILDYSKATVGKIKIELTQLCPYRTILSSIKMLTNQAKDKFIIVNIINQDILINADAKYFKQSIINLLSNAIKFTPSGGKITISDELRDSYIIIKIQDTGVGIAQQDLSRALTPFGQIQNKLSNQNIGTGIGLPLTKKLIELMDGEFKIRSIPDVGTSVFIKFKIIQSL